MERMRPGHPSERPARPGARARRGAPLVLAAIVAWGIDPAARAGPPGPVDFGRDVLPILSENCFTCHGPDAKARKAGLRLDVKEGALRDEEPVVVPGQPDESELIVRVTSRDADEVMPPPKTKGALAPGQVEVLRRWIGQGANWGRHWAFETPRRPALPAVRDRDWPRGPIDHFVLARLEAEGLAPSPQAEATTLIRRVTLDLTGLPPSPGEVDAFLADRSPDAYEKLVDRLLQSPRYGERMAARWLDAARYADTNGYQSDGERTMWRWRDWVIDAYNRNMPFDRFTIEQLAGDLLPNPSLDQMIATGFNRNHRGNAEGGIIPEEYAVEYVVDRVETTATVWLGLTIGCARCHDHKFDPISQREFYRLFAFFNNVPERGKAIKFGNSPPLIKAPTPRQQEMLWDLDARLAAAERRFRDLGPELASAQASWERALGPGEPRDWAPSDGLVAHFTLDGTARDDAGASKAGGVRDGEPAFAPGKIGLSLACDGRRFLDAGDVADFGFYDKFSCGAWIKLDEGGGGVVLSRMVDEARAAGYSLAVAEGRVQVNLVQRWLDDAIRVESVRRLDPGAWHHVMFTYDGSRVAEGVKVYVDGSPERLAVLLDDLNQSFQTKEPLRIGGGGGPEGRFRGLIDDVRVYDAPLEADVVALLAETASIDAIVAIPPAQRTDRQAHKLRAYYLEAEAPDPIREARRRVVALRDERDRLVEAIPTTMVMREMDRPREAHILLRGAYDKPGDRVTPGVPACLPPLPPGAAPDRLALARWLVDPANPLTARVAVNRAWQMLFGTGLVKTAEDFGTQGERPSHPELLDWLASEFVRTGWDVKALLRAIVTSASYRQASHASPELLRRDPEDRLLARGPRLRLPAEVIRDQALAAGGLLVERLGGPSVRPYQPPGLWKELTGGQDYRPDTGPGLYRRGLYTFWKRTAAPPSMATFDAAGREACTVREVRTNTPLQALTLMNDETFVEAARALAGRALAEAGPDDEARVAMAFRIVTARRPGPAERAILLDGLRAHRARFVADREAARHLIRVGASAPGEAPDPVELASYTAVASMILNLDEAITKE
jgi:hypothetical protein